MATEKRLIDANAIENEIRKMFVSYGDGTYPGDHEKMIYDEALVDALYTINEAPTVDAVEVVHGRWKDNHCTVCGMMPMGDELWDQCDFAPPKFEMFMDYCPNCGADMR